MYPSGYYLPSTALILSGRKCFACPQGHAHNHMKQPLPSYLRPYRLRWGLTQQELTYLIGVRRPKLVSALEHHKGNPRLSIGFALHVVFGTETRELFPSLFADVEEGVIARAYDLYDRLQGKPSKTNRVKLDFLEDMFERARERAKHADV